MRHSYILYHMLLFRITFTWSPARGKGLARRPRQPGQPRIHPCPDFPHISPRLVCDAHASLPAVTNLSLVTYVLVTRDLRRYG